MSKYWRTLYNETTAPKLNYYQIIVEFELNPNAQKDAYAFTNGETITATSTVQDVSMSFTVKNIVSSGAVASGGALYGLFDPVIIDDDVNYGNGEADGRIEFVNKGSVSDVIIDDAGMNIEKLNRLLNLKVNNLTLAFLPYSNNLNYMK